MRFERLAAVLIASAFVLSACAKSNGSASAASSAPGAAVYNTNCASCHQAGGKGLAGAFPPLAGNPVVTGDPVNVIHIVKYGLSGKVMVGPDAYNGMMPPWASQLSDAQIAAVVSYIRSSWGNAAPAVSAAQVSAVSK